MQRTPHPRAHHVDGDHEIPLPPLDVHLLCRRHGETAFHSTSQTSHNQIDLCLFVCLIHSQLDCHHHRYCAQEHERIDLRLHSLCLPNDVPSWWLWLLPRVCDRFLHRYAYQVLHIHEERWLWHLDIALFRRNEVH